MRTFDVEGPRGSWHLLYGANLKAPAVCGRQAPHKGWRVIPDTEAEKRVDTRCERCNSRFNPGRN